MIQAVKSLKFNPGSQASEVFVLCIQVRSLNLLSSGFLVLFVCLFSLSCLDIFVQGVRSLNSFRGLYSKVLEVCDQGFKVCKLINCAPRFSSEVLKVYVVKDLNMKH